MDVSFDAQLAAIANPTRRVILQLTRHRERSAGELANKFSVSRSAVSQHVRVLVAAGLLRERRDRQHRLYQVDDVAFEALRHQFDRLWTPGLTRLKAAVEADVAIRRRRGRRRTRGKGDR